MPRTKIEIRKMFPAAVFALVLFFAVVAGVTLIKTVKGWSHPSELDGFIPPTISIESPQNNKSYVDMVPLNFSGTSGGFEPESIYWGYQLWGGGYSYSLDGQANVSISGNTTLTGLPTGTHCIVVFSYYYIAAGQLLGPWSVSSEPVYFTVISDAPAISVTTPENKTYNTVDVALNFTVNKPTSWIAYNLDSQENVTISENTTLSGLSNGSHHITVYANDTSNNMAASKTIYFSVDVPFPTTFVVAAVSGASLAIVGVGLLVYFKKRKH